MVRNAYGVFKNNQLPKRFVLCENMHKNGVCTYQNACQFAHTLAEVTVWSFQKERGIRDHDQLLQGIMGAVNGEPLHKRPSYQSDAPPSYQSDAPPSFQNNVPSYQHDGF